MLQEEFQKIVDSRRSNRAFDPNTEVPDQIIERGIKRAILAPNSSNMQLWEFQWIESKEMLQKMIPLCLGQSAAKTAKHMVVFITRKDKWRSRAKWNYDRIAESVDGKPGKLQKGALSYYKKLIPIVYFNDPFGVASILRKSVSFLLGIGKPFYRLGGKAEQRIVVHKSCALAAQTFMLSIAAEGLHSCPMEGFDRKRVKKLLQLPRGAEINMIVSVGKGTDKGIWGERHRVPYEEVVLKK
ncbi:MAG: nitroreductase family protein [Crocinitomicaceae bacterium]|tara:strand:- start:20321 stop:21043 length:723 start_codon:yes stop_codon:yes gene_type:complete